MGRRGIGGMFLVRARMIEIVEEMMDHTRYGRGRGLRE